MPAKYVRVRMVSGQQRIVEAQTFAEAAAQVNTRSATILRFEWATVDDYDRYILGLDKS